MTRFISFTFSNPHLVYSIGKSNNDNFGFCMIYLLFRYLIMCSSNARNRNRIVVQPEVIYAGRRILNRRFLVQGNNVVLRFSSFSSYDERDVFTGRTVEIEILDNSGIWVRIF